MPKAEESSKMERREFIRKGCTVAAGAALMGTTALVASKPAHAQEGGSKFKWGFLVDLRRCTGCKACAVSCKAQNGVVLGKFRTGVKYFEYGTYPETKRAFVPWLCNHCEKPVCIENCPVDEVEKPWGESVTATYKRPDGIVAIDQDRCVGCGNCVDDCPYDARFLDPETKAGGEPDENAAAKCDLCLHRLENGVVPACVNACPMGARAVVNLNDPEDPGNKSIAQNKAIVKGLLAERGTGPQCFYIDPQGILDRAYRESPDQLSKMNKA